MTESAHESAKSTAHNPVDDLDSAVKRVQELSERVTEQARQNGLTWLESYEKVLRNVLDLQQQAAKGTGSDWVEKLATTQADFIRETSNAFIGALRAQLEK